MFTPFSRAWREHGWADPVPTPRNIAWRLDLPSDGLPDT